jgi:hypothetical protein
MTLSVQMAIAGGRPQSLIKNKALPVVPQRNGSRGLGQHEAGLALSILVTGATNKARRRPWPRRYSPARIATATVALYLTSGIVTLQAGSLYLTIGIPLKI